MASNKESIASEHAEQVTLISEFKREFPSVLIFSIPNGGFRDMNTAKKLKAEGAVKGIPDLFIPAWKTWVEMKRTKGGTLSPEQKKMKSHLESIGYKVIVGKGWAHAMQQLKEILK
jgi:hypothetical protein